MLTIAPALAIASFSSAAVVDSVRESIAVVTAVPPSKSESANNGDKLSVETPWLPASPVWSLAN